MAWVALWGAFHQTRKYSFLMISPKLLDFSPFFFLISSPLGTADFLVLLELSHCYPFSSQLVLNLTLALSWVSMGHLLKLCKKGHIRVLHLTVHELSFGAEIEKDLSRLEPTISCITIQCCTTAPYFVIQIKNLICKNGFLTQTKLLFKDDIGSCTEAKFITWLGGYYETTPEKGMKNTMKQRQ